MKCAHYTTIGVILATLIVTIGASPLLAAEFKGGREDVEVTDPAESLYVSGGTVTIKAPIAKDLVVAGGRVIVAAPVERNVLVVGGQVELASEVGGTVRAAGGEVSITGSIADDLVVAGGKINVQNAEVGGDVLATASRLTMRDSTVGGDLYGSYEKIEGNIDEQVNGSLMTKQFDMSEKLKERRDERQEDRQNAVIGQVNVPWEMSVALFLFLIAYWLHTKDRLRIPSIRMSKQFGWDILIGVGVIVLPVIAVLVSVFLMIFPVIIPLAIINYMALIVSFVVLPIYIANFVKNTFKLDLSLPWLVFMSYLILFIINLVQPLSFLNIFTAILMLGMLGFLTRTDLGMLNDYLKPRKTKK